MNTLRLLLHVIRQSNSRVMRIVLWSIPVALFIVMSIALFINHLLASYEQHVIDTYLGNEGRLSIESDAGFLEAIHNLSRQKTWEYSRRYNYNVKVIFSDGAERILKSVEVVILEDDYFKRKFALEDDRTAVYNTVLSKSFGTFDIGKFTTLFAVDFNKTVTLNGYEEMLTGFLSDRPKLFVPLSLAHELVDVKEGVYAKVEYMESDDAVLREIEQHIIALAKTNGAMEVKFFDLLKENATFAGIMEKIRYIELVILLILLTFAAGTIMAAIEVMIYFKKRSLETLHHLGVSGHALASTFALLTAVVGAGLIAVSYGVQPLLQGLYLEYADFSAAFFVQMPMMNHLYGATAWVLVVVMTYVWSRRTILRYMKVHTHA
jgi:hypothetical protein